MKKITKSLSYIFLLLAVIIASALIYVVNIDLNKYKDDIEKSIENIVDADLVINGNIDLDIFPNPEIEIENVYLYSNLNSKKSKLVSFDKLEAKLALFPLLNGKIIIPKIYAKNANIILEKYQNNESNWNIVKDNKKSDISNANSVEVSSENSVKKNFNLEENIKIENLSIIDSSITYTDFSNPKNNHKFDVKSLNLLMNKSNDDVAVSLDSVLDGKKLDAETKLKLIAFISSKTNDTPIKFKINYDRVNLDLNGEISKLNDEYNINLAGLVFNPKGNYSLPEIKGDVNINYDNGKVLIQSKKIKLNGNDFETSVYADLNSDKIDAKIKLNGDYFYYKDFVLKKLNVKKKKSEVKKKNVKSSDEFILPYDLLKKYNLELDVKLNEFRIDEDKLITNLVVKTILRDGMLKIPASFQMADGVFNANINVNSQTKHIDLSLNSNEFVVQKIDKNLGLEGDNDFGIISGGKANLDIKLNAQGEKISELKSSLDGEIVSILNKSYIETGALSFFDNNIIGEIIRILPIKSSKNRERVNLECAVVRTNIKNGIANFPKSIVFSTDKNNVVFDGNANLKNEKIDFMINPYSNRSLDLNVSQLITSFIRVSGSITDPKVRIAERKATVKTLTGVLTSGLSIAGEQLLMQNDPAPCYTALQNTNYKNYFPAPEVTVRSKTTEKKEEAVKKINKEVDRVKEDAKKIFNQFEKLF